MDDYICFYKNQLDFGFRKPGSEDYISITGKSKEVVREIFKHKVFPSRFQITPDDLQKIEEPNFWKEINTLIEKSNMSLRIYGTNYDDNELDISFLLKTPTLRSLSIQINCLNLAEILPKLVNLKELEIHIGDYVRDWDL